eukprot:TRINITY_DN10620_c0_g1_i1.p1 TRINITY_DN10620_c0_g1~~TRINITY_DN10620_c0_g1_i1.p1  ORF type:complete len:160 (-),score=28.54 TRINITY_DN10620_c0_g1_i1:40-519(-)
MKSQLFESLRSGIAPAQPPNSGGDGRASTDHLQFVANRYRRQLRAVFDVVRPVYAILHRMTHLVGMLLPLPFFLESSPLVSSTNAEERQILNETPDKSCLRWSVFLFLASVLLLKWSLSSFLMACLVWVYVRQTYLATVIGHILRKCYDMVAPHGSRSI